MSQLLLCGGRPLSLIVLAGGQSRRMGTDKAFLPFPEGRLIEVILRRMSSRFAEVIVSVSSPGKFEDLGVRCIEDEKPGQGPMMGLKTALGCAANDKIFVLPCDIPEIDLKLVENLIEQSASRDIVIPVSPEGYPEPLFGVYSRNVLPKMTKLLESGERSLLPLLRLCRTKLVPLDRTETLGNLNAPEDYLGYLNKRTGEG